MSHSIRSTVVVTAALALAVACHSRGELARTESTSRAIPTAKLAYPVAARGDVTDDYHGTAVADPYRWLEDPDSAETRAWVEAENRVTFEFLGEIPERAAIRERLTALTNYERFIPPVKKGERYFFSKNDGLQNQNVVYVMDSLAAAPRALIDPNTLSKDGTVALSGTVPSDDGKLIAYGVADGGSDWTLWRVRDVASGTDRADVVRWVKFSQPSWAADGSGFFYSRYDEPKAGEELRAANYSQKVFFHRLGSEQKDDVLVYERPDQKEWGFQGRVTEDGRFLVIGASQGTDPKNRVFYKRLEAGQAPDAGGAASVVGLLTDFDASYDFLGNEGDTFWFLTNLDAPRQRVIAIDVSAPERSKWRELVPQGRETLLNVEVVGGHFIASYLEDAHSRVRVYGLDGLHSRDVELPGLGTTSGFFGEADDPETFYSFASFTQPGVVYHFDVSTGASEVFRAPKLLFDPSQFKTEQIFCESKDGTRVPLFVTYKRGMKQDGQNPTLLYGYGGFNVPLTPSFSATRLTWLERGGIYAVANLRGGGEYGEEWHQAGAKLCKQNVFDDFISAAEHLIEAGYTSTPKLAIQGGSNGGLLVGACITQRPDLFGAALPAVGVMDMLRFQKFTIGWAWTSDYGSSDDSEQFKALYAYSPLHNIVPGTCYPPTMITTADHDDRVVPAHSFKFAAELQQAQGCANPILIRIDVRAGHGAGKPTSKIIEQAADEMAFLVRELGM